MALTNIDKVSIILAGTATGAAGIAYFMKPGYSSESSRVCGCRC